MSRKGSPNKVSKKIDFICSVCLKKWKDYPSRIDTKKFCSNKCRGVANTEPCRERSVGNNWGSLKKITPEFRNKISLAHTEKQIHGVSVGARNMCYQRNRYNSMAEFYGKKI